MEAAEEIDIVIVGAGICGLATALALHRKGIKSVVLERSETLRAFGSAIAILTNGWRALDQLGIGPKLRQTALPLQGVRDIWLDGNKQRRGPLSKGEARCVKRSDLINMLAQDLPHGTIRFGCHILFVELDPLTNFPILQLRDGRAIKAKILIGCDGASSVVAEYLKVKPKKSFPAFGIRGLTYYPSPHGFDPEFVRTHGNNVVCGRSTINQNLVFWFLLLPGYLKDSEIFKDPELIKQMALEKTNDAFPKETIEMIKDCDITSLSLTHLWYRPAWDILLGTFRKGMVTLAGDSMHVMGPFLGQGGSAAMEDAVVLARCLANKIHGESINGFEGNNGLFRKKMEEAMDLYVKERRMRLVRLSAQSYVTGLLFSSASMIGKILLLALIIVLFQDPIRHTRYDCGHL
ncbi:3-hydroxybenzoate 6-hydroxylase 1 [Morus notabilis]|uniref:3-hydroxybenzoate 6-hydroxylase 1 n=1 Tax=Morus notabilis TaxID=981085 RepID=W9S7E3_9ROSA|nr:monooxygenase 1 [Morus notabilis]EXC30730.1 3-hydroxybenzoate 6-hydroxylase 1 [Morus notabilis]